MSARAAGTGDALGQPPSRSRHDTWPPVAGISLLGGVGFTISLFVTELAFGRGPAADAARVGVLLGSLLAGGLGCLVLRATPSNPR